MKLLTKYPFLVYPSSFIIAIIGAVLIVGCSKKADFKVGDCIVWEVKHEFYTNTYYDKIVAVGKTEYKYAGYKKW